MLPKQLLVDIAGNELKKPNNPSERYEIVLADAQQKRSRRKTN